MSKFFTLSAALSLLLASGNTFAHSEHDKARFVAPTGQDKGLCDNVLRPCKSISYAVSQANKGDKVLLSAGHYRLQSIEEVFYLKSSIVPVMGGYNRFDHYQSQSPQVNQTTLTNVPADMAEDLRKQGFNVVTDGKSFSNSKELAKILSDYQELSRSQANQTCENGKAGVFDCDNVDLLAHFPLTEMSTSPAEGTDIWGHVDLNNGREYAIMGVRNGVIVVDVTDPTAPKEVGTIDGVDSGWRDVKVYQYYDNDKNVWQAYAYATSEGERFTGNSDKVIVIDLNSLPNSVSAAPKSLVVDTAHNVYISNVDHSLNIALPGQEPVLQLVGANAMGGAFINYSLESPRGLTPLSNDSFGSGYTHDGSSIQINDDRAMSDCGISEGPCNVFIDFNENEMKLWDITDPNQTKRLSSVTYTDVTPSAQYIHSGWGTEDNRYIIVHDEFDEFRGGLNTTIRIYSIDDLTAPVQVGQWTGPTGAIDHNGFVRGNRYYMSNYTRGLTILDISDPENPVQTGFFDTYTPNNSSSFSGAWGVYPYLPSGNILISDINSGLYILSDKGKASSTGSFSFSQKEYETEQGTTLSLTVSRNATDASEASQVSYQVLSGSANIGDDFTLSDGTLSWGANDNGDKTINISITAEDSPTEYAEKFFIRLYNPTNGAVLGDNGYANVNIDGIVDTGTGSFELESQTVAENSGTFQVNVSRVGSSSGELSFTYGLTDGTATVGQDVVGATGSLAWADGDTEPKSINIEIIDDSNEEQDETFTVVLTPVGESRLGTNPTMEITIADDDANTAPTITMPEDFESNTEQTVTLSATSEDAEGDDVTYLWQQTEGTDVTLTNADSATATFVAPSSAGTLTFSLTVTDIKGAATTETVTVTIVAPTVTTPDPAPVTPTPQSSSGGGSSSYLILLALSLLLRLRNRK